MPSRPSTATVLATLALVVAVGVPTEGAFAGAVTTKSVKKIAKKIAVKQADKEIARKAPGLSVARASNADALGGIPAGDFQRTGATMTSFSAAGWLNSQPVIVTVYRMPNQTQLSYASTGLQLFTYPMAVPVQVGGAPLTLTSVRYCYTGAVGVHLTSEKLEQVTFENGVGTIVGNAIQSSLDLADNACRTFTVNRVLGPHDQVSLEVGATWNTANATLRLGEVTATFSPS